MRRVDWPIVLGPGWHATFTRKSSQGVVSVLSAADELVSYRDSETIIRRSVELARDRLGLERVALFLLRDDGLLYGTFGTGMMGETTDERDIMFTPGDSHRDAFSRSLAGVGRWLVLERVPLVAQLEDRTTAIGHGWNALTPVRSRSGITGLFVNDAALSKRPIDDSKQVQLAVLATIVANLLELKGQDAAALPWSPTLSGTVGPGSRLPATRLSEDVVVAMARMCEGPMLDTSALAKAAHVTPRALARHFREQVGATVVDYRNRLRVERFLARVDRGGGNLLEAALEAGFGSYAQFHRVFRRMLGVNPHEYVTGRDHDALVPARHRA